LKQKTKFTKNGASPTPFIHSFICFAHCQQSTAQACPSPRPSATAATIAATLKLSHFIHTVLVSDPDAEMADASVDVHVGSWSGPDELEVIINSD